ncbi:MAG: PTS sugar transporter subunit IIC [Brevinema sp.]
MMDFIEKKMMPILTALNNIKHIVAIREGMISTIPLTIVGSFFLLIAFPPIPQEWFETIGFFQWIATNRLEILIPFRATMGLIAVYVVYNTAYTLSSSYNLNGITGGTLALVAFFITQSFPSAESAGKALGLVLPIINLGSAGLFVGILTAFVSTEIFRWFKESNLVIKMPDGVPPSIMRSFEALYPMACILILFGSLHFGPKIFSPNASYIDLHTLIGKAFSWLSIGVDSLPGALFIVFFICMLWVAGIHGVSIIGAVARPIWLQLLDSNAAAFAVGETPAHIFSEPFYQWYVWIGGSGATIGLVLLSFFIGRSSFIKSMGRATIIPALFNINEPVIFGYPIVLNPVLAIPFIIAPMVMTVITWFAINMGFVPHNVILAPWTFPGPLGAYISSGGSVRALILNVINIGISCLVYLPFLLFYDKQMLLEEQKKSYDISQ